MYLLNCSYFSLFWLLVSLLLIYIRWICLALKQTRKRKIRFRQVSFLEGMLSNILILYYLLGYQEKGFINDRIVFNAGLVFNIFKGYLLFVWSSLISYQVWWFIKIINQRFHVLLEINIFVRSFMSIFDFNVLRIKKENSQAK